MMFYLDESESINNHFIQNKKELSINRGAIRKHEKTQ